MISEDDCYINALISNSLIMWCGYRILFFMYEHLIFSIRHLSYVLIFAFLPKIPGAVNNLCVAPVHSPICKYAPFGLSFVSMSLLRDGQRVGLSSDNFSHMPSDIPGIFPLDF